MPKSTSRPKRIKPKKPDGFPLVAHPNGQWSKQVRGKVHYFGCWEDPDAALALWLEQKDDLLAGRVPCPKGDVLTVKDLCNLYLEDLEHRADRGKVGRRTFSEDRNRCVLIVNAIGNCVADECGPPEFNALVKSYPKTWGVYTEANQTRVARRIFKWAYEQEYLDRLPRWGNLKLPSKRDVRRAGTRRRAFTADEIRSILASLTGKQQLQLRAMVLLGINGGFGPQECAQLQDADVAGDLLDTTRGKTGMRRLVPLWPETREAIGAWLAYRKRPHVDGWLFVTKYRNPWWGEDKRTSPITQAFKKVLNDLAIDGSFYCLRHTFQTVCDDHGVPRHVSKAIMGHVNDDISANYSHAKMLEPINDAVGKVHDWLFDVKQGKNAE